MKNLKIYINIIIAGIVFMLNGCVKDTNYNLALQTTPSTNTVGFVDTKYEAAVLDIQSTPTTYNIYAQLFSTDNSNPAATVTIVKDTAALGAYNRAQKAADSTFVYFEFMPDSVYKLTSLTGTPDSKTHLVAFPVQISTSKINLTHNYAICYSIASVDKGVTVASNKTTKVLSVNLKNKYDGQYELKGYHNRSPYNYPYDQTESLVTYGASSVAFYWDAASSYGHPIGTGVGTVSWYGSAISPVIVFDPNTNLVTNVYNIGGTTPITMYTGSDAGVSRYDPSTKTVYVYWNYNNNPARAFFDTLTYIGPRP